MSALASPAPEDAAAAPGRRMLFGVRSIGMALKAQRLEQFLGGGPVSIRSSSSQGVEAS